MKLYTAKQIAQIYGVTEQTVWRWGRQGKLKTKRIGRTVRFELVKED